MKLIIVHYHFRPGGVRRVIEVTVPHIVRRSNGRFRSVVLVTGESPDAAWLADFRRSLGRTPLKVMTCPAYGYVSEQRASAAELARRVSSGLRAVFRGVEREKAVVWAHNLSVGRNLVLARELIRVCEGSRVLLVAHQHDWWFDRRWQRWPEMRRCGFRSLRAVADAIFYASGNIVHATINREDAVILSRHCGGRVHWLPNPAAPAPSLPAGRLRFARRWLCSRAGGDGPVWLFPGRLLRRKNIAEALLLTRWLRPGARLVTTGGVGSADEMPYAEKLAAAAREHGWPLHLGVLAGSAAGSPSIGDLMAASEAVLSTSIQEGFGMAHLEAPAAGCPLIARRLADVTSDLAVFGFRFPQSYDEIFIAPDLFDWPAEVRRQAVLFRKWLRQLPQTLRKWAGEPVIPGSRSTPHPVPFSRLTLSAQLEVLARPAEQSFAACEPLNPFLRTWRKRAAAGCLRVTAWPSGASRSLGGAAYAARFRKICDSAAGARDIADCKAAQEQFIRARIGAAYQFPLLWSAES